MKIAIIARGLTKGGVARYIRNILHEFEVSDFQHEFHLFTDEEVQNEQYKKIQVHYIPRTHKLIWDYFAVLPSLRETQPDVVLYPKNIIPITHHWFLVSKKINVIHDLAYFDSKLNEYQFLDSIYMKTFMGLSCRIADKIIAVSNHTKKDIVEILHIHPDKIEVIYEGVEKKFKRETDEMVLNTTLQKFNIKQPFMFYCGSLSPRKNMLRVMQAYNQIKDQIPHNIYLAGGQSWHDKEVLEYISTHLSNRVFRIGYVTDNELIHLYSTADLFLYPSLYEGFGLPILEAQACGCPVLTSDTTSCAELSGQSIIHINPKDLNAMCNVFIDTNKFVGTTNESLALNTIHKWSECVYNLLQIVVKYGK